MPNPYPVSGDSLDRQARVAARSDLDEAPKGPTRSRLASLETGGKSVLPARRDVCSQVG